MLHFISKKANITDFDRQHPGRELADHKRLTLATDTKVYFCDPHIPWQRGTNQNTNDILGQYFPQRNRLAGTRSIETQGGRLPVK